MTMNRVAALEAERADVLDLCAALTPAQWQQDSRADGWRVRDVIAHLGASCHALFTPAALTLLRTPDIESANDTFVDARRHWSTQQVVDEYRTWSARVIRLARLASRTPLGAIRAPLGELGSFRFDQMLTAALVFDHHTHIHHDICPSLEFPAPDTDANRMATVLDWMMAMLANQLRAAPPAWLPGPIALTLTGPGGGTWHINPDGSISSGGEGSIAAIESPAITFPSWATRRTEWRRNDLQLTGHTDYATRLLDSINIV
ncbi:maleylpyruvate isomerase family mycothiol-dependent enzyme [Mycobacterium sp. pV006]|uniref:maleylpyruvate isomerase family mycothiol-dependent enzyme n=1 Tax=Mycobacterium sp. pV006 TaxID=3238983 RepID=UPI00351B1C76